MFSANRLSARYVFSPKNGPVPDHAAMQQRGRIADSHNFGQDEKRDAIPHESYFRYGGRVKN